MINIIWAFTLPDETWISAQWLNVGTSIIFSGHDIDDAVFPMVKNDLPAMKRGLLEIPPFIVI